LEPEEGSFDHEEGEDYGGIGNPGTTREVICGETPGQSRNSEDSEVYERANTAGYIDTDEHKQ
jgi:hypothetical protein